MLHICELRDDHVEMQIINVVFNIMMMHINMNL